MGKIYSYGDNFIDSLLHEPSPINNILINKETDK